MEQEKNRADAVKKVKEIIESGEPFVDDEFPACKLSIYNSDDDLTKEEKANYDKLTWKRATEIFEKPQLIIGGLKPNDIKQGYLGNSYLLAILSAISEDQNQIMDFFETKEVNETGVYLIYLYVNGIKTPVIVDDYFPCYKSGNIAFCKSQ